MIASYVAASRQAARLKIIATHFESAVIEPILKRLGLQARAPPSLSVRGDIQQAA